MKKLIFILCLCSTVSVVYGQVKVSLSYQHVGQKTNYYVNSEHSGTIQSNVIWQFSPYLSTFTGVGYNSNELSLNTVHNDSDKYWERGIMFCGVGLPDEYYQNDYFSSTIYSVEIPLGIRLNTPSFFNFEAGLSVSMTGLITTRETTTYRADDPYSCFIDPNEIDQIDVSTRSSSFSSRIDVALDIQYNLGRAWQISLAGTWSPYDLETSNSSELTTHEAGPRVNGQKGARIGLIRIF